MTLRSRLMSSTCGTAVALMLALPTLAATAQEDTSGGPPATRIDPVTDTYHGDEIVDNYRWLEGDNSDPRLMGTLTEEVREWTAGQNGYTRSILDGRFPEERQRLENTLRPLMELGSVPVPAQAGGKLFFTKREKAEAQPILYVQHEPLSWSASGSSQGMPADGAGEWDKPRKLLDPVEIDPTGLTAIQSYTPSPDGSLIAFGLARAGDENATIHVLNVETGRWLADEIPGRARVTGWLPTGDGFVYSKLEDPADPYSNRYALHMLGESTRHDRVIVRQAEIGKLYEGAGLTERRVEELRTGWGPFAGPSTDGRWLIIGAYTSTRSLDLWIADMDRWMRTGELVRTPLIVGEDGRHSAIASGDWVYLLTFAGAPNGRVVRVNAHDPRPETWREIVPHRPDVVIEGIQLARGRLVVNTMTDASSGIELYDAAGESLGSLDLPGIGSASLSTSPHLTSAYLRFASFNTPTSVFRIDLADGGVDRTLWDRVDFELPEFGIVVERVSYPSADGTEIGMFLIHKEGVERNGDNPTMLYGYGGFNISMTPYFSPTLLDWLSRGGVYAVANLRGGGEKGLEWHRAGMLERKQNTFDDFIAAAEWLIETGYTSPERLAIIGGSNGGLLVGAAMTQRPDLFAAVVCGVPLLDMLRFEQFLMARFWVPEYGSAESAEQYPFIRAYSPYQNIEAGTDYPAALITAGENDTRVHPMHARKMAAALQASTNSDPAEDPILLWVEQEAGHGSGKPLELRLRDLIDSRLFIMWQTGMLTEAS